MTHLRTKHYKLIKVKKKTSLGKVKKNGTPLLLLNCTRNLTC